MVSSCYKSRHFCGLFPHFHNVNHFASELTWVKKHYLEANENDLLYFTALPRILQNFKSQSSAGNKWLTSLAGFHFHTDSNILRLYTVYFSVFVVAFVKLCPENIAVQIWSDSGRKKWREDGGMKRGFEQILWRWWQVLCFPQRPFSQRPGVHESIETQVSPHHGRKTVIRYHRLQD